MKNRLLQLLVLPIFLLMASQAQAKMKVTCPTSNLSVNIQVQGVPSNWQSTVPLSGQLPLASVDVDKSQRNQMLRCHYGDIVLQQAAPASNDCYPGPMAKAFDCWPSGYTAPQGGLAPIAGRSLKELSTTAVPTVMPYQGMPNNNQQCLSCHAGSDGSTNGWTDVDLCKIGKDYASNPAWIYNPSNPNLNAGHPFGGQLKSAMMKWAQNNCQ